MDQTQKTASRQTTMKNLRIGLAGLAMALVALTGCKDDDISVLGTTQGSGSVNVSFTASVTATDELIPVTYSGTASGGTGSGFTFAWSVTSVGGGTASIASPAAATTAITFTGQDTYTVTLTVTDSAGTTSTFSQTILIGSAGPPTVTITQVDVIGDTGVGNVTTYDDSLSDAGVSVVSTTATTWTLQYMRPGPPFAPVVQTGILNATGPAGSDQITVVVDYK